MENSGASGIKGVALSQTRAALGSLARTAETAEKTIERLRDALAPALLPEQQPGGPRAIPKSPYEVPVAEEIDTHARRINECLEGIELLIGRLSL